MLIGCFIGSCVSALMIGGHSATAPAINFNATPAVTLGGREVGLYVDDSTPPWPTGPCDIAARDRAAGYTGMIIVSVAPTQSGCSGAINAIEWFPDYGDYPQNVPCAEPAAIPTTGGIDYNTAFNSGFNSGYISGQTAKHRRRQRHAANELPSAYIIRWAAHDPNLAPPPADRQAYLDALEACKPAPDLVIAY
jgi:hypothetical protein